MGWSVIFKKSNIICGVIYRQHNSPEQVQSYFDETLEIPSAHNKPVYVMGDFNIQISLNLKPVALLTIFYYLYNAFLSSQQSISLLEFIKTRQH